jgi:hypothetical protein
MQSGVALSTLEAQHAMVTCSSLQTQSKTALRMGVALSLRVRAARQGSATGADQASWTAWSLVSIGLPG